MQQDDNPLKSRLIVQDMAPAVTSLVYGMTRATAEFFTAHPEHNDSDAMTLVLLACASVASAARESAGLDIAVWAEANKLAADPLSLINQTPPGPDALAEFERLRHQARLAAHSRRKFLAASRNYLLN